MTVTVPDDNDSWQGTKLYKLLNEWSKKCYKVLNVPKYTILQEQHLKQVLNVTQTSKNDIQGIF